MTDNSSIKLTDTTGAYEETTWYESLVGFVCSFNNILLGLGTCIVTQIVASETDPQNLLSFVAETIVCYFYSMYPLDLSFHFTEGEIAWFNSMHNLYSILSGNCKLLVNTPNYGFTLIDSLEGYIHAKLC